MGVVREGGVRVGERERAEVRAAVGVRGRGPGTAGELEVGRGTAVGARETVEVEREGGVRVGVRARAAGVRGVGVTVGVRVGERERAEERAMEVGTAGATEAMGGVGMVVVRERVVVGTVREVGKAVERGREVGTAAAGVTGEGKGTAAEGMGALGRVVEVVGREGQGTEVAATVAMGRVVQVVGREAEGVLVKVGSGVAGEARVTGAITAIAGATAAGASLVVGPKGQQACPQLCRC